MKKFKSKKRKKYNIKIMLFFMFSSFILTSIFFNKNNTSDILFFSENILINDIKNITTKKLMNLSKPENIIYASLNSNVKKEDLSVFNEEKEGISYEKELSSFVENTDKKEVKKPIIYLYNTHQLEEYNGKVVNDYNIKPNVLIASYILKEKLNKSNINTIVEENNIKKYLDNNKLSYKYSYKASRHFLEIAKKNNPTLNYFIDIHRDSIKKDKSTIYYNKKGYATVLFIVGLKNKNYYYNLSLEEKLSNKMNLKIPNISKGIMKKSGKNVNGIYNQDIDKNVILIEIGGNENTLEEVNNTLDILSSSLKEIVEEK